MYIWSQLSDDISNMILRKSLGGDRTFTYLLILATTSWDILLVEIFCWHKKIYFMHWLKKLQYLPHCTLRFEHCTLQWLEHLRCSISAKETKKGKVYKSKVNFETFLFYMFCLANEIYFHVTNVTNYSTLPLLNINICVVPNILLLIFYSPISLWNELWEFQKIFVSLYLAQCKK